ncbi:MAG TPA: GIY-YIG nuclease family protein [Candidatus Bathyarchaeia archaeon]|nr:GIY-YIG nuclease family protein [Candidatus Bathyarchaeia archaeon]
MRKRPLDIGVYAIVMRVTRSAGIGIGRLGSFEFQPGIYVYIGSALNSLPARIARHFRQAKRSHWHIDYLTSADNVKMLGFAVRRSSRKIECAMSRALQRNALTSINRFGSSDCNCVSHLHRFANVPAAVHALHKQRFRFSRAQDFA